MIKKIKKLIKIIKLAKERECDYLKLEKILFILNNHMYLNIPTKREYYNLINDIAEVINPNYNIGGDFGKTYIEIK